MHVSDDIQSIRWSVHLVHRNWDQGFDARVGFRIQGRGNLVLDHLIITLGKNAPEYKWERKIFAPRVREYLEHRCQIDVDKRLVQLDRTELGI